MSLRIYAVLLFHLIFIGLTIPIMGRTAENPDILLNIEEPQSGERYAGVANLRGWAVAPIALERIEVYLDGIYLYDVPLGGNRGDVAAAFPSYSNARYSGFAMAFNYGNYSGGPHELALRAVDINGNHLERRVAFEIERFPNPYITSGVQIDAGTSFTIGIDNSIAIQNLIVEGQSYDLTLRWRKATQGFAVEQITP